MVDSISPNGPQTPNSHPKEGNISPPYKSQMYLGKAGMAIWRKYWQALFPNTPLEDKDVQRMTDQFMKYVWDQMNSVLKWALQQQKDRDKDEKEQRGG